MAQRESDEAADALHAMMNGEAPASDEEGAPAETGETAQELSVEAPIAAKPSAAPVAPEASERRVASAPAPAAAPVPGAAKVRPTIPVAAAVAPRVVAQAARPARPTAPPGTVAPAPAVAPAVSSRPAAPAATRPPMPPGVRPVVRPARPAAIPGPTTDAAVPAPPPRAAIPALPHRPATPPALAQTEESEMAQSGAVEDATMETPLEEAAPLVKSVRVVRKQHMRRHYVFSTSGYKQTIIPPLLTCSLLLVLLAITHFIWPESLLDLGQPLAIIMGAFGLVLIGVAAVTMMSVKHQMASEKEQRMMQEQGEQLI